MDDAQKADRAQALINDDLFKEAISVVKEYHTEQIFAENTSDEDVLRARGMVLALEAVTSQLESYILTGEMSKGRHRE